MCIFFKQKLLLFQVFKKNSLNPSHLGAVVSVTKGTIPVQSVHLQHKLVHNLSRYWHIKYDIILSISKLNSMLIFLINVIFTYSVFELVFNFLVLWIACVI